MHNWPGECRASLIERATGIEPASEAWEASILPMNYARQLRSSEATHQIIAGLAASVHVNTKPQVARNTKGPKSCSPHVSTSGGTNTVVPGRSPKRNLLRAFGEHRRSSHNELTVPTGSSKLRFLRHAPHRPLRQDTPKPTRHAPHRPLRQDTPKPTRHAPHRPLRQDIPQTDAAGHPSEQPKKTVSIATSSTHPCASCS